MKTGTTFQEEGRICKKKAIPREFEFRYYSNQGKHENLN